MVTSCGLCSCGNEWAKERQGSPVEDCQCPGSLGEVPYSQFQVGHLSIGTKLHPYCHNFNPGLAITQLCDLLRHAPFLDHGFPTNNIKGLD